MKRAWALVAMVVGVAAGWSCLETCIPGKTEPCACTDGRVGAQICRSNGTFEPCICTGEGGTVDAGLNDAGARCTLSSNAPNISWFANVQARSAQRVALGQPVRLTTQTQDFDNDPLERRWLVLAGGDAGAPGVIINALGDDARIEFPEVGNYTVELHVSDGCRETVRQWELEVVPALKLPFIIKDFACCDAAGRAFAIDGTRAQVLRLGLDGGVDAVLETPKLPRHLFFDANHTRLIVAQDAWVSFIGLADFELDFEWPVGSAVNSVVASDTQAWVYGDGVSGSRGVLMTIDGGVLLAAGSGSEPRVSRGYLSEDGGRMVILETTSVRSISLANSLTYSSSGGSEAACGELWQVAGRRRFVTGCGKAYELGSDGGLVYVGALKDTGSIASLAEGPTGELAMTWWDSTNAERQLRIVSGSSFSLQAEFGIGLWQSELEEPMDPGFLILGANRRVYALTPDPGNDATWWQEF